MSRFPPRFDPVFALLREGRASDAAAKAQRLFTASPRDPSAAFVLSDALLASGQVDRALHFAGTAAALAPRDLGCQLNHANLLGIAGKLEQALAVLGKATTLAPTDPSIYSLRVGYELDLNRPTRAERLCREGLTVSPGHHGLRLQQAASLLNMGRVEEALPLMREVEAGQPDNPEAAGGVAHIMNYSPDVSPAEVLAQHRRYGELLAASEQQPPRDFSRWPEPGRLRIGIVSPDLRTHSVAWFIEPFLEYHDRTAVEVYVYQTNFIADAVTQRLKSHGATWRVMDRVDDPQLAEVIFADRLHILIELSGHTHAHSLRAMHRRPAPLLITYLGYPNITGVAAIDRRIVDSVTDPPVPGESGPERPLRIDPCFLCYKPPRAAPVPAPPPSIAAGHITFGTFNTVHKINRKVIALWARVLSAVPGSRLLLKCNAFSDPDLRTDMHRRFVEAGIAPDRVEVLGRAEQLADHLALYSRIDIALDPVPYNGTTTTCEALYMGVPVITLAGEMHAGRVGASLLTQAGLKELIARDETEYVSLAASLASDRPRLASIRAGLRATLLASPLCDGPAYAGRFVSAMREAWRQKQSEEFRT